MTRQRSSLMQQRVDSRRSAMVQATRELVAKGGFRSASMVAVATQAGISAGLIYRYFPSKAALFAEVLEDAVAREIRVLEEIAASGGTMVERLRRSVESFVRRALAGPELAYAFIAEPVEPEIDAERIRCRRRFGDFFRKLLEEGVATGEVGDHELDVVAACIVGAYTEALVGPTAPTRNGPQDVERLVESICDFCLRALPPPTAAAAPRPTRPAGRPRKGVPA